MKYVIGVDLGTSAVKILLVNQEGHVVDETSKTYPLIHHKPGYSEQSPHEWVKQTMAGLKEMTSRFNGDIEKIEGISFSGQMHGLVLLDQAGKVLRDAILWNDTRTTEQCQAIYEAVGKERFIDLTGNVALEGFTLPKILWVKKHEPEILEATHTFLLPKDYVRYVLTGELHMDYSDAAGTIMLDRKKKKWSDEICEAVGINPSICPPLVESHAEVGTLTGEAVAETGLSSKTKVFAGGADNACGAIGAGILSEGKTLCSIGTSGVVLSYEETALKEFGGQVHYFNHGEEDRYYVMGVTLSAGHSLSWFKDAFAKEESYDELLSGIGNTPIGAAGLLFTPYLSGERTPHTDAKIRGSFIGLDSSHTRDHLVRAVLEGITFSLNDCLEVFRSSGKKIETIISIGGGAKNQEWLQMQADIFNANVVKLSTEQGPGLGAAMLAAYGCGWFQSLKECSEAFITSDECYTPIPERVERYRKLFEVYQTVYAQTKDINHQLMQFK